jgi:AP endonuclease-1
MATKLTTSSSESSLSPPPEDVAAQTETVTVTTKAMKRQASTGSNAKVTKRVKTKKDMKGQAGPGSSTTPRPKRRAPNQATVEDVADEEFKAEVDGDVKTKVTKKTTTRKKKDENLAPLEERTTDTPLWIGAHVSTAGG